MPTYISHSRKYYRRFYRLVACAVILMMAVLTGSLALGDSVRGTLVQRVNERLGKTETVITSGTGFMSEALTQHPLMSHAMGILLMDGFVSIDDKLLPVYVWGTDADSLSSGEVMVNETLRKQLGSQQDVVLHLPSHHLIPSGSLFVTKSYATQMRVHVAGVKSVEEGGNWLLKNEQTLPLNVFINRQDLAEKMELDGRINLVLSSDVINEEQLAVCWSPELSGIHVTDSSLTSDAVFIPQNIVAKTSSLTPQLYLSYFVNALIHATDTLFYSFVTAVNEWQGEPLDGKDIILSDYAAGRLHVHEGDSVSMSYYMTKHLKNLDTRAQTLKVKRIVPLSSFRSDSLLLANFPGLTHVEKCTDWDSDLPINMNKVQKEDEDFWHDYRQTPKAIVSYEAHCPDWSNTFGSATAMRFSKTNVSDPTSHLSINLVPGDAGVQLYHPRAQGLSSAKGGVDFAGLFLSLGFFIILAAILLVKNPLVEMFILRQGEIQLYCQLGFKDKDIRRRLFYEAFSVMLFASPLGVIAGLAYSCVTLWLLGNVWSGATHTEGFALHISPLTLLIGWVIGMLVCAATLYLVLRSQLRALQATSHLSPLTPHPSPFTSHLLFLLTIVLTTLNFICFHSMVLFIVCGLLWILTWGLYLRVFLSRRFSTTTSRISLLTITWQTLHASMKQHLLAYWTLAIGVFMVFAVGLNRPDFSQFDEATGGYQVYVDSRVPIQYDLNNPAVRRKLSLHSLPDSTWFLSFLRHTQDEASCLNLHQVSTPTVLGIDLKDMEPFGLTVTPHLTPLTPHLYIDQESLMWSLMKSVGDTLFYQDWSGERVPVVIAGTYPTGVFHGNAMMSQEDFRRLWPNESGVEVLLIKSPHPDEAAEILSMAMNEYGLNIQTTDERIRMFFEVTETYLVIFLTLGGLGLLLGIFSLMIIVRKNLSAEMPVIHQYRAMGFPERLIRNLLLRENLLVPFYAVCIGAVGSVISISANVGGAGLSTLLLAFTALVAICLLLYFGIKIMVMQTLNNQQKI